MTAQTNLDLMLSAERAALASLALPSALRRTEAALLAFTTDGNDERDYEAWGSHYEAARNRYGAAKLELPPSARAAQAAPAAKTGGAS